MSYSCFRCQQSFTTRSKRNRHVMKQICCKPVGERQIFECTLCDATFTRNSYRRQHEKRVCKQNPKTSTSSRKETTPISYNIEHSCCEPLLERKIFKCDFCVATFTRNENRRRHEKQSCKQNPRKKTIRDPCCRVVMEQEPLEKQQLSQEPLEN